MKYFYPEQKPEIKWHMPGDCKSCSKTDHKRKFSSTDLTIINHETGEVYQCNTYADALKDFFPKANNCLIEVDDLKQYGKVYSVKINAKVPPQPFEYTAPVSSAPSGPKTKYTAQQVADFVAEAFDFYFKKFGETTQNSHEEVDNSLVESAQRAAVSLLIQCQIAGTDLVLDKQS